MLSATKYLKPISRLITKTGADFIQVCHLVDLKLLLDNRKTTYNGSGRLKSSQNSLVRQSLIFIIVGLFLGIGLMRSGNRNPFSYGLITQSYLMIMLTISLLSEYSVSLFDTRDNQLLLPLPVNGETLGWARVIHILVYLLLLYLSISLPIDIIAGIQFGPMILLITLLSGFLNTLFTLFLTIFIYLVLMKFTRGERLKDVLMYIQVGFSLLIMLGYQFISYKIGVSGEYNPDFSQKWFFLLLPPAWFSYLAELPFSVSVYSLTGSILALFLPPTVMFLIAKKLFKGFDITLNELSVVQNRKVSSRKKPTTGNPIGFQLARIFMLVSHGEYPVFKFMWHLSGRERLFKQSVLPVLGYTIVLPLIMLFSGEQLGNKEQHYQILMYFTIMVSNTLPLTLPIGNSQNTGWIFQSMPDLPPGRMFLAALKAVFGRFFIPVFILTALPLFYFKGLMALPTLLTLYAFNYMISLVSLYFQPPLIPFSQGKSASQGGKNALRMMLVIFLALPFGFLMNYLSSIDEWLVVTPVILFIPVIILFEQRLFLRKFNWKFVEVINRLSA